MGRNRLKPRRVTAGLLVAAFGVTLVGCGSSGSSPTSKNTPLSPSAAASSPDFGTMKNVCHGATGQNRANSDLGVTANSIKITTISDAGSSLQRGLNQELWDATTVFTRWCNEHGGINGRRIEFIKGDAQVVRYADVIDQACKTSFALVGGGGAFDNMGQEARLKCELVAVPGFVASAQARGAALNYPAMATGIDQITGGSLQYIAAKYGDNEPVASVYGNFETTEFTIALRMAAAQAVGLTSGASPVNQGDGYTEADYTYNVAASTDWRPVADAVKRSKAKGLIFSGQPADLGKLINALAADGAQKSAGGTLEWVTSDENMYDQVLIQNGRTGLSRGIPMFVQTFIYPFEEANKGEASLGMDDFQALFEHYLPSGKSHAMFAVSSFASWLLFVQAASECGANLTRDCLVNKIKATGDFDAGGLIAARDPANPRQSSECFALLQATPDGFHRVTGDPKQFPMLQPTEGTGRGVFNCNPTNITTITATPENGMQKWFDASNLYATVPKS